MSFEITEQFSIQNLDRSVVVKNEDIKKQVEESMVLPFINRINHPKWQVRKRLYENLAMILETNGQLMEIDQGFKDNEGFCKWIVNLLGETHTSSFNEAIRIIELFTNKYNLGVKEINCFIGSLIEKASSSSVSIVKFQSILQNCTKQQSVALTLVPELAKYLQNKNNKISLLSLKGINMIITKYELNDKKHFDLLFDSNIRILEQSTSKQIREISLQITFMLTKYSKQSFQQLIKTKFKKIRPIVLKQLIALKQSDPSYVDNSYQQQPSRQQQIDLKTITPPKLLYFQTINDINQKKILLQQFEKNLQKSFGVGIIKKDYFQIYNAIEGLIEQSNQIVSASGLRILKLILKLNGHFIADNIWKRFFVLTTEKYKGAKSQSINQQIHSAMTVLFESRQIQIQVFVDSCFQVIEKGKNQNAKTGIIDWWISQYPKLFENKNVAKLKQINGLVKKKVQNVKKSKGYLGIKNEIENLNLALNNMQTFENRSNNLIKTHQINGHNRKEKSSENVLSFTQAMKMSSTQKQLRLKKKEIQIPTHSQTNQSYYTSYQSPVRELPPRQPTHLQAMQGCLQNVKKSILSNNINSIKVFFSDFNNLLNSSDGQFFQILNLIITFVDQLIFSDLKKSKASTTKQMNITFELISKSVTQLNKQASNIDEQGVKLELILILSKIEISNMKLIESFLDTLYMASSLQIMLKQTLTILKTCEYYFAPAKEFYSNWLSKKIELVGIEDIGMLNSGKQFQKLDQKIYKSIIGKSEENKSEESNKEHSERLSFTTPKKQGVRSGSLQSDRSRIISLQTSRQSNYPISEDIAIIQQIIVKDYLQGIEAFDQFLNKKAFQSSHRRSASKVNHTQTNTDFTKIIKYICKHIEQVSWNEAIKVLIKYKMQFPSFTSNLLQLFLVFSCTKTEFKDTTEHALVLNFIEIIFQSLDIITILSKYKSSFLYVYFKFPNFQTETFLIITLPFIISRVLKNELSLNECEYLINPLCFGLLYPSTYSFVHGYLRKIHKGRKATRSKVEQLLKLKIKDQSLRVAYDQWLNKEAIQEMEICTISQVPELVDEISNCKSLVDGLQQFGNKSIYSNSIKFTSPIVGFSSKTRELDSIDRQYMRQPSKSSTVERPVSILKNFHSSKEILELDRSLEHYTQVQHFQQQEECPQIKQIDTYESQKQQLRSLIQKQTAIEINDSIKQLRQLFLTSQSHPQQVIQNLWQMFISLETEDKQNRFLRDLRLSVWSTNFILSMSEVNYYVLLSFVIKISSNIPYQKHQSQSSYSLRQILNLLLTYKNPNTVLIICIRILNHHLTSDFSEELLFQQKLMFRLIMNCIQKLSTLIQVSSMRSFQVLLEIYKFFKTHPPQNLVKDVPSLKQIQNIFNGLKQVTNIFIQGNTQRAKEFLTFIRRKNNNSIYLTYVDAMVDRL